MAITAEAMPFDIERGLAADFIKYFTKPIDLEKLIEALNKYCIHCIENNT